MAPRRHRHVSRGSSSPLRRALLPLLAVGLFVYASLSRLPSRSIRRRVATRSGHVLQSLRLRLCDARNVHQVDSRRGDLRSPDVQLHDSLLVLPFSSHLAGSYHSLRSLRLVRRHRPIISPGSFCEPTGWTLSMLVACARLAASLEDLRVAEVAGVTSEGGQVRETVVDDGCSAALSGAVQGLLELLVRSILVDRLLLQGQVVVGLDCGRR